MRDTILELAKDIVREIECKGSNRVDEDYILSKICRIIDLEKARQGNYQAKLV